MCSSDLNADSFHGLSTFLKLRSVFTITPFIFPMDLEAGMRKTLEATQRNFNTIRTGRANPSLLDKVVVEYYGAETPLKSLATLSTPDAQTIQIQPFDLGSVAQIEKAIAMSDLGLTPNNDGKTIRINIPPLTEEIGRAHV